MKTCIRALSVERPLSGAASPHRDISSGNINFSQARALLGDNEIRVRRIHLYVPRIQKSGNRARAASSAASRRKTSKRVIIRERVEIKLPDEAIRCLDPVEDIRPTKNHSEHLGSRRGKREHLQVFGALRQDDLTKEVRRGIPVCDIEKITRGVHHQSPRRQKRRRKRRRV